MNLGWLLSLGRLALCHVRYIMIDLMVFLWIIKDLDIFYNLTLLAFLNNIVPYLFGELLGLHDASCLGVAVSVAFQIRPQVRVYVLLFSISKR